MIILEKNFNSLESVKSTLITFPAIAQSMYMYMPLIPTMRDDSECEYEDFVIWAIKTVQNNIPSPFSISYPSCYGLNIGSNFFTLRFPCNYGIGIKINSNKSEIDYEVNFIFYGNEKFVSTSKEYKTLINSGWTVKPKK